MKKQVLLGLSLLSLVSCQTVTSKIKPLKITVTSGLKDSFVLKPNEVNLVEDLHSLSKKRYFNTSVLPSIGDVKVLVIPMLIPGYETIDLDGDGRDDKEQVLDDIDNAFFGLNNKNFESVASFYKKSSFDKLHLDGTVTKWFDVARYTPYKNAAEIDLNQTDGVVEAAVKWAKEEQGIDLKDYDYDGDGFVDGVWCIYSAPDYTNGGPRTDYENYWAYTYWGNQSAKGDVNNPVFNLYGWASYDFMYEGYGKDGIDAHTYIHETGHFLGLNDYYSDDFAYNPLGKLDMMDMNMIDHNSYSKMILGWSNPYIIKGNGSVNLSTMDNKDNFVVVLSDSQEIVDNEFDPFSEYMLFEHYAPTGLNYHDVYESKYGQGFKATDSGIRAYHVDNRKYVYDTAGEYKITEYDGEVLGKSKKFMMPLSNARNADTYNHYFSFDIFNNLYDEIRMIEATGKNTFSYGGKQGNDSLFKDGDSFSMSKFGKQFFINENTFDNGDTFSSEVQIGGNK